MTEQTIERPCVMIVDDSPQNLRLLENMLTARGYSILALPNGHMALRALKKAPPDIILLDISLPDMNGYEVCRHIKDDPNLAQIPVIFISALDSQTDKLNAFKAGGVDYITKPFNIEEVNARVSSHLKIAWLEKQLQNSNRELEEKVANRTKELASTNKRLKSVEILKNDFLNMICYEMRTPITGLERLLELLFNLNSGSEELSQLADLYEQSRERINELLDDAIILTSLEEGCFETRPTLDAITLIIKNLVQDHNIELSTKLGLYGPAASVPQYDWLKKAIDTLIMVAACFSSDNKIKMSLTYEENAAIICFRLDQLKLNNDDAKKFFDITSTVRSSSHAENLGLAPVVAQKIISLYGGKVELDAYNNNNGILNVKIPVVSSL